MSNGRDDGYKIASRPPFFTEQFERVCPYYISFGMSYEQFWDGDVDMAKAYRKAHELKMDEANEIAWVQGMYVYQAIGALSPALKAFSKGRVKPYMKYPIGYEERQLEREERLAKKKKQADRDKAKTILEAWAVSFNERWEKEQKEKEEHAIIGGENNGS